MHRRCGNWNGVERPLYTECNEDELICNRRMTDQHPCTRPVDGDVRVLGCGGIVSHYPYPDTGFGNGAFCLYVMDTDGVSPCKPEGEACESLAESCNERGLRRWGEVSDEHVLCCG